MDHQTSHQPRFIHQPSSLDELLLQSAATLKLNLTPQTLSSTESVDYLAHLSSLPLPKLVEEPVTLQSTAAALEADLSLVCFREFRTFLLAHEASTSIKQALRNLDHSLDLLLRDDEQLSTLTQTFGRTVEPILKDRNQMTVVLDQLSSIEDLLELPQLVSTCINARLWNEAIELGLKAHELDLKMNGTDIHISPPPSIHAHPNKNSQRCSVGVLKKICNEVDRNLHNLRDNLLGGLKDPKLKLPLAVRTVVVLRRLTFIPSQKTSSESHGATSLSEPQLRMALLTSRWQCLNDNLRQLELSTGFFSSSVISSSTPDLSQSDLFSESSLQLNEERTKFMRRWVEMWREFVGDTVSMYIDIFLASTSSTFYRTQESSPSPSALSAPQFLDDPHTPLNVFISESIELLFSTLRHHLNVTFSVSNLASLLTQLTYCGVAFGKWGMDFTSAIGPMIVDRVEGVIRLRMQLGLQQLQSELRPIVASSPASASFSLTDLQTRGRSLRPMSSNRSLGGAEDILIASDSAKQVLKLKLKDLAQPEPTKLFTSWLSLFPPVVRFVNSQLTALNELRLLPPATSYPRLSSFQIDVLRAATEELRGIALALSDSSTKTEGLSPTFSPSVAVDRDGQDSSPEGTSDASQRKRGIVQRLFLVWYRNILPVLERSLRIGIYSDLNITSPDNRFNDTLLDCESFFNQVLQPAPFPNDPALALLPKTIADLGAPTNTLEASHLDEVPPEAPTDEFLAKTYPTIDSCTQATPAEVHDSLHSLKIKESLHSKSDS